MRKKILIIEDDMIVRENTAEILQLANYQVMTAENGRIGLEKAAVFKPHLIICAIRMRLSHIIRNTAGSQAWAGKPIVDRHFRTHNSHVPSPVQPDFVFIQKTMTVFEHRSCRSNGLV